MCSFMCSALLLGLVATRPVALVRIRQVLRRPLDLRRHVLLLELRALVVAHHLPQCRTVYTLRSGEHALCIRLLRLITRINILMLITS